MSIVFDSNKKVEQEQIYFKKLSLLLPPSHNVKRFLTRRFLTLVQCQKTSYIMRRREQFLKKSYEKELCQIFTGKKLITKQKTIISNLVGINEQLEH